MFFCFTNQLQNYIFFLNLAKKLAEKVAGMINNAYLCSVKHQVWLSGQNPEGAGLYRHRLRSKTSPPLLRS